MDRPFVASLLPKILSVQVSHAWATVETFYAHEMGQTWQNEVTVIYWLPLYIYMSFFFKVDWNFNLIFNKIKKKAWTFKTLNLYNAVFNYATISQLFISVTAMLFKIMQMGGKGTAVSTHCHQKCLQEKFVHTISILIPFFLSFIQTN